MTKWVGPYKIIELNKTTLRATRIDLPYDPGVTITRIDLSPDSPDWPQNWYKLLESQAIVAIAIEPFQVLIEPYNPLKHGPQIEIEIDYDRDRNAQRWLEDLLDEWAESRGLSRDNA